LPAIFVAQKSFVNSAYDMIHGLTPLVPWEKRTLAVPLAQLEPIQADQATKQAVGDWHYWVEQGYEF